MEPGTHTERHFTAAEAVRDLVIGMSDGLTVPFALAAGLSGAVSSTAVIVIAGLAEIAAGSIAMGLGGYLAARTDAEHYAVERAREERETIELADRERQEVMDILTPFGLDAGQARLVAQRLSARRQAWIDFMRRFELGLEAPDPRRAWASALTIAAAYAAAGLIPLAPYIFAARVAAALTTSVLVTLLALFLFGYLKGRLTGLRPWRSAVQTALVGGAAAAAAFAIARAVSG